MTKQRFGYWCLVALLCVSVAAYYRSQLTGDLVEVSPTPARLELIVSGSDPYWESVIAGAKDAARQYGAELEVRIPKNVDNQTQLISEVNVNQVDGVAVSPLVPTQQLEPLNQLSSKVKLVTLDNDHPESKRHCYVGTDNYSAGRTTARLLREALPDGGEVVLFIGDTDRQNGRLRRQGFFDELTGKSRPPGDFVDPLDEPVVIDSYQIVKTYVDDFDRQQAAANVRLALKEHPDTKALVGFYAYHGPKCLQVLAEKEKIGQMKIIAFDDRKETLEGVESGEVYAAIIQDTYHYGYEAIRLLSEMVGGADYAVPAAGGGSIYLPCTVVKKENLLDYFQTTNNRTVPAETE